MFSPLKNAVDFRKQVAQQYGADSSEVLKHYPSENDQQAAASQLNLSRDMIFGVQNYAWANINSSKGRKTFVYRFTRKVPGTGEYAKYGAFHTGEVPYAYNNLKFVNRPWEAVDNQLASAMSSYFANFIKSGDPNGDNLPQWPAYENTGNQIMLFGNIQEAKPMPDKGALDFMYKKMSSQ